VSLFSSSSGTLYSHIAIEIDRDLWYAYKNKGIALNDLGSYKEALQACEQAIDLAPEQPANYLVKSIALYNLEDYQECSRNFFRLYQKI
jgi:superkiller protein 3